MSSMTWLRNLAILTSGLALSLVATCASADSLKPQTSDRSQSLPEMRPGDSIPEYMKTHPVTRKREIAGFSKWVEGIRLTMATYNEVKPDSAPEPMFLLANGKIPYGVMQGQPPGAFFLFDTDCDGKLDFRTTQAILPICIVLSTSQTKNPLDRTIVQVLDWHYRTFQSEKGPADRSLIERADRLIETFQAEASKPNRDLAYLIWYYQEMIDNPKQALLAMKFLQRAFEDRYQFVHPVITLYQLESSINAGDTDAAREYMRRLRREAPDFIPGKFYEWRLMDGEENKLLLGAALRKKYPNHWLIQKITG